MAQHESGLFDIGFLGGGQLARMSIHAAQQMGATCLSLDPGEDTPASQVAPAVKGALHDPHALAQIIKQSRRITLENEFIPAQALREAFQLVNRDPADLLPGIGSLEIIQDKLLQRRALASAGVPGPRSIPLTNPQEALEALGLPMVLKARFGGYDGKGTRVVRTEAELFAQAELWETASPAWLAEEFVPFRREVAVMVVRTATQSARLRTVETVQPAYVCDHTYPANWRFGEPTLSKIPEDAVAAVGGFGLFGVEMFELEDGTVLVNELAPRPHNTGHYSMDWNQLSQFDLHVRAVLGEPIPEFEHGADVLMLNLLGREADFDLCAARKRALRIEPDARIHWYGKSIRPGRKVGHINMPSIGPMDLERALAVREAFFRA